MTGGGDGTALIEREFRVQPGSTILWTGDVTNPNVDLTVVYSVDAFGEEGDGGCEGGVVDEGAVVAKEAADQEAADAAPATAPKRSKVRRPKQT